MCNRKVNKTKKGLKITKYNICMSILYDCTELYTYYVCIDIVHTNNTIYYNTETNDRLISSQTDILRQKK